MFIYLQIFSFQYIFRVEIYVCIPITYCYNKKYFIMFKEDFINHINSVSERDVFLLTITMSFGNKILSCRKILRMGLLVSKFNLKSYNTKKTKKYALTHSGGSKKMDADDKTSLPKRHLV
ncbi:hypothetical protein NBO_51g0001 [Nosema bombycis CQ1]|uniref:Uncharacterized protein n=1 Tax=Nosema bombycis (strain CQ1 / CVCC 102059) TaxID=578461 RepID=R0MIG7_NOSB1|nr:hypothetical protein NBO_51g0001 [Nosema bombycis CQ1]|eukprot:EOB13940.1 hypothetical protein NBO_51g0001 [Nosema bombycis CQ1]